jgi:ADP-ribose pyrophosphatase YjhB (NUDIX family)
MSGERGDPKGLGTVGAGLAPAREGGSWVARKGLLTASDTETRKVYSSMADDGFKYRQGYSIGVGAVVVCGARALLVRSALGEGKGEWAIPGGFVEPHETIEQAVHRELWEETGVKAELKGLIAARSRVTSNENSAYFVFLMHAPNEDAHADGVEVEAACYFSLTQIQSLPDLRALSRFVVSRALEGKAKLLEFHPHPVFPPDEFVLFL